MKYLMTLCLLALTGCSGMIPQGTLANRVSCSVAKDEAYVVSKYGPVGISSTIDPKDTAVICK